MWQREKEGHKYKNGKKEQEEERHIEKRNRNGQILSKYKITT